MKSEPIDLMQEFVELYQHEEMMAFFEFSIERPGAGALSGLCKISKPKGHDTTQRYLSLTFMADTPDDASTTAIETALDQLERDAFRDALPSVDAVVPVPTMTGGTENYVRQFDLMLNERLKPGEPFVMERLLPALRSFAGLHAHHVVWWDAEAHNPAAPKSADAPEAPSVLGNLRSYLKRFVDSERK
jgi:hypothetical protein